MIFSTALFFFFFATVFLVQWWLIPLLPEKHRRSSLHSFLLVASYVFYSSWDYRFAFLIAFSTILDYFAGRIIARYSVQEHIQAPSGLKAAHIRKVFLILSIAMNLGILAYFKYADFFIGSFTDFVNVVLPGTFSGDEQRSLLLNVILPLGISFFTFQSMSYTIDVYRGIIPVEKNFLRFALFVSFFPQLVAGPIVTAREFLPQLEKLPVFNMERMRVASRWFLLGFCKKVVIADNVAPVVDMIYASPESYDTVAHWLGAFGFWVQVYCDFSGYSDMAWGTAIFLGFVLPENFRIPYISRSVTEHWQRWHMSLIRWIRDYLYIPLGGSRVSYWRHKRNVFLVMFLAGIWHGANWTFFLWGTIHGTILVIENILKDATASLREKMFIPGSIIPGLNGMRLLYTSFCTVFFGTMFRSQNIGDSFLIMQRMLGAEGGDFAIASTLYNPVLYGIVAVVIGHIIGYYVFERKKFHIQIPLLAELLIYVVLIVLFMQFGAADAEPFIYFVF